MVPEGWAGNMNSQHSWGFISSQRASPCVSLELDIVESGLVRHHDLALPTSFERGAPELSSVQVLVLPFDACVCE